jgi:hypothetical protein
LIPKNCDNDLWSSLEKFPYSAKKKMWEVETSPRCSKILSLGSASRLREAFKSKKSEPGNPSARKTAGGLAWR